LRSLTKEFPLAYHVDIFNKPAYRIAITERDHPSFETWVGKMRNEDKLVWIAANGQPYPVLWLKISRVADYWWSFFNHWTNRGDTGYLDADFRREPNALWSGYQRRTSTLLEEHGFSFLTNELAQEKVPSIMVLDYDSIPGDDPRWDDDDYEPPAVPSSVYECLFCDE
jgi:hypothetical protein